MRACVVGGGLAGSLLAWRLAREATWQIDLLAGDRCDVDATAASGGAVRAFERHPEQRRLAIASMAELLASQTLRQWADYLQVGSVYLVAPPGPDVELVDIERALPGSVRLASPPELTALGWAGVPADAVAVFERDGGYTSPGRLRAAVLADGAVRRRVSVVPTAVRTITLGRNGSVICDVAGRRRAYDLVVVAAGAWTGTLLQSSDLPAGGYRTKSIQYAIHRVAGRVPPPFVDELTGLYGRPTRHGGLLLGLPTEHWDIDPNRPPTTPPLHHAAVKLARARFPGLRIGPSTRRVGSADCYADQPGLALRRVIDTDHRLFTFTGGAGGSVKTALAASHRAAIQLTESGREPEPTLLGPRKGQL